MIKYQILHAGAQYKLEELVNKHLREGWRPLGGVSVVVAEMAFSKAVTFYQAIEKDFGSGGQQAKGGKSMDETMDSSMMDSTLDLDLDRRRR